MKNKKILIIALFLLMTMLLIFIFTREDVIDAYYIHKAGLVNVISLGEMKATVNEENYTDGQVLKPNSVITKVPYLSNSGDVDGYVRAQVYVPVANIRYIEEENDKEVVKSGEKELVEIIQDDTSKFAWQKVTETIDADFSGQIQDSKGNKYNVYTYRYMENGEEPIIKKLEDINIPVFNSIKVINYLDLEQAMNLKVFVKAIAIQTQEEKNADDMWTYYKNQNGGSGIGEVK